MSITELSVLVTRPVHQADPLCQKIKAAGGAAYACASVEIEPVPLSDEDHARWQGITTDDWVIVLSANAVLCLDQDWPQDARVLAIGPATQAALAKQSVPAQALPASYNSEGLLAMSELQMVEGRTIYIVAGESPRPLLLDKLRLRGADVVPIISYRRRLPVWDGEQQLLRFKQEGINAVVLSSVACAANLVQLLGAAARPWLKELVCVVSSPRIQQWCQNSGCFDMIYLADGADDAAVIAALESLHLVQDAE